MKRNFPFTQPFKGFEPLEDECSCTDSAGYRSSGAMIMSMINAGIMLDTRRRSQHQQDIYKQSFSFPDGVDDGRDPDPTRASNYDLADMSRDIKYLNKKAANVSKRNAAKAEGADEVAPPSVSSASSEAENGKGD